MPVLSYTTEKNGATLMINIEESFEVATSIHARATSPLYGIPMHSLSETNRHRDHSDED